jgi:hypothetical protein
MNVFRFLCWWLPKCRNCGSRDPLSGDVCFACSVVESKARMWRGIADAAVQISPYFVEAMTDHIAGSLSRAVRRHHRRNPTLPGRQPGFSEELRELKRIADLPDVSPVEPANPDQGDSSGEAKTKKEQ